MKTHTATATRRPGRTRLLRHILGAAAVATLTWFGVTAGGPGASASADDSVTAVEPVGAGAPGYAVEDFDYPGADKILAERGITLKRGDGHIVLADCASEGELVQVKAMPNVLDTVCFRVTGDSGWLSLEMPSVFSVKGNDYNTQVSMTTDGDQRTWDVDKNLWTSVGESADDQGREYTLVEIRASK